MTRSFQKGRIGPLAHAIAGPGGVLPDTNLVVPSTWHPLGGASMGAVCDLEGRVHGSAALAAGVPFSWFTADEAYRQAGYLREWLEGHGVSYVKATRCDPVAVLSPVRVHRHTRR